MRKTIATLTEERTEWNAQNQAAEAVIKDIVHMWCHILYQLSLYPYNFYADSSSRNRVSGVGMAQGAFGVTETAEGCTSIPGGGQGGCGGRFCAPCGRS